jgi:diguanylate cyclase (GGDEF)-like protein
MAMVSIKKFLDRRMDAGETIDALVRFIRLFLHGLEQHSVESAPAETARFRQEIRSLASQFESEPDPSEILIMGGALVKALQEHNLRASQFIAHQSREYNAIVGMLARAVAGLADGCDETVTGLQGIARELEKGAAIEDIREVRSRLAKCLEGLRGETARHKQTTTQAISEIKKGVSESQQRLQSTGHVVDLDRCTGLPGRPAAERCIAELASGAGRFYAAVFVVDRVQMVNQRFGAAVGDKMIIAFAEYLQQNLSKTDRCFRWSGPSLLVMLEGNSSHTAVRSCVQRLLPAKLEKNFEIGSRSVLLPITATWTVVSIAEASGAEEVFQKLDDFVCAKAPETMTA